MWPHTFSLSNTDQSVDLEFDPLISKIVDGCSADTFSRFVDGDHLVLAYRTQPIIGDEGSVNQVYYHSHALSAELTH